MVDVEFIANMLAKTKKNLTKMINIQRYTIMQHKETTATTTALSKLNFGSKHIYDYESSERYIKCIPIYI